MMVCATVRASPCQRKRRRLEPEIPRDLRLGRPLRNFSLAADKLCTTQAAVSNRIATLERELGVRLFERDCAVSLTLHGQRALPQAEAIMRQVAELERSIADAASCAAR